MPERRLVLHEPLDLRLHRVGFEDIHEAEHLLQYLTFLRSRKAKNK